MKITKKFEVESAHIVRNCFSDRCSRSIHGHSYTIEVELESNTLAQGDMVLDFGLFKNPRLALYNVIDMMDHSFIMWSGESEDYKKFIKENNARWVEVPFIPSAEMLSVMIFRLVDQKLDDFLKNEEYMEEYGNYIPRNSVWVSKVIVHETSTGRAECDIHDVLDLWNDDWQVITSKEILL